MVALRPCMGTKTNYQGLLWRQIGLVALKNKTVVKYKHMKTMICTYTISYVKMECKIWSFQTHDIDLVPQAMKQVTQGVNISHWHSDWLIVNLNLAIWPWNKKWMFPFQYTRCCQMVLKMYKTSDTSSQYLPMTHWLTAFELDHLCPMTLKKNSDVFLARTYTVWIWSL